MDLFVDNTKVCHWLFTIHNSLFNLLHTCCGTLCSFPTYNLGMSKVEASEGGMSDSHMRESHLKDKYASTFKIGK